MTNSDTHAWLEPRYSGNDGVRGYASAVRGGHENFAGLPHTEPTEPAMVTIKEFSVLLAFDHHRWKSGSRSTGLHNIRRRLEVCVIGRPESASGNCCGGFGKLYCLLFQKRSFTISVTISSRSDPVGSMKVNRSPW